MILQMGNQVTQELRSSQKCTTAFQTQVEGQTGSYNKATKF